MRATRETVELLVVQAAAVALIAAFLQVLDRPVPRDLAFAGFAVAFGAVAAIGASLLLRIAREAAAAVPPA